MDGLTAHPRLDRSEQVTTGVAVVTSTALYLRYGQPYLARGVVGDLLVLGLLAVPLVRTRTRARHEAAWCLAGIGVVQLVRPRWPLGFSEPVWWAAIGAGLAGYVLVRSRSLAARG